MACLFLVRKHWEYRKKCPQTKESVCSIYLCLLSRSPNTYPFVALPFSANFAAGAIAGISEILTFYPLGMSLASLSQIQLDQLFWRTDVVRNKFLLGRRGALP